MRDDALVLAGTVPTFHLKQIAQELAAHTRGVAKVENRLQVTNRPSRREN
jgi:osmotically-inducible protein OsmY